MFLPHPRVKVSIVGSLRDREVAYSVSDRQGTNFESCAWRTVSSQSSHHPQEVLLAQFSLYVHKGGLKPDSFHFIFASFGFVRWSCLSALVCIVIYSNPNCSKLVCIDVYGSLLCAIKKSSITVYDNPGFRLPSVAYHRNLPSSTIHWSNADWMLGHRLRRWPTIKPTLDVCHRGCAYTVLQSVQRAGVCSAVYGTVHYKEPLNLFDKSGT